MAEIRNVLVSLKISRTHGGSILFIYFFGFFFCSKWRLRKISKSHRQKRASPDMREHTLMTFQPEWHVQDGGGIPALSRIRLLLRLNVQTMAEIRNVLVSLKISRTHGGSSKVAQTRRSEAFRCSLLGMPVVGSDLRFIHKLSTSVSMHTSETARAGSIASAPADRL